VYGENVSHWSSHKTRVLAMKALETETMMMMMMMTVKTQEQQQLEQ